MCAHYTLFLDNEELRRIVQAAQDACGERVDADIYPGMRAPVMKVADGSLQPQAMLWGFPAKGEGSAARRVFNTRVETAREKPLWRNAYAHRRCLVPASGFEEWQHHAGGKTLYRFSGPEGMLYIAGIYERRADGNEYFSMMTTRPNSDVRAVHDRMPLVLRPDEVDTWLYGPYDTLADRAGVPLRREEVPQDIQQLSLF